MPKKSAHKNKFKKGVSLKKEIVFFCSCCAAVFVLSLSAVNLVKIDSRSKVLGAQVEVESLEGEQISGEMSFWEDFLKRTPSYLDGWLELATLELQSGNKAGATAALVKAGEIDPNSEKLKLVRALVERP